MQTLEYMQEKIMNNEEIKAIQAATCHRLNLLPVYPDAELKIGLAIQTKGQKPIIGMRAVPANGTEGWYIWAGDYSEHPNFFTPIHIHHLQAIWPEIIPYLALPPHYRFIIDDKGYEDIWYQTVTMVN